MYELQTLLLQHPFDKFLRWNSTVLKVLPKGLDSNKQSQIIFNALKVEILISNALRFEIINILMLFY